ncbi:FAD-dependent oxidoreductase [Kordia sp.]|uniref:FAD-dependent oxidoreductase n=1 Tax=Kordia sp. TaxID=1965332 RepID=UPI003D2782D1
MNTTYDITIIGGGIIGLFTAYLASKKFPDASIVVIDQNFKSTGATFYSIALDIPYGHSTEIQKLSKISRKYFSQLDEIISYERQQIPFIGITAKDNFKTLASKFNTKLQSLEEPNFEATISKDELTFSELEAWQSIPYDYLDALKKILAAEKKVKFLFGLKVVGIEKENDGFALKTSRGIVINTKNVINATGPWLTDDSWKREIEKLDVRTKKIISYHLPFRFKTGIFFFDHDAFITPKLDAPNESIYSFRANEYDVKPQVGNINIHKTNNEKAYKLFNTYFPNKLSFEDFSLLEGRCFCDAYATVPIAAEIFSGYIVAGAGSGSGFRLAPAIAETAISFIQL